VLSRLSASAVRSWYQASEMLAICLQEACVRLHAACSAACMGAGIAACVKACARFRSFYFDTRKWTQKQNNMISKRK